MSDYYAVHALLDAFGNGLGEFCPVFLGYVFAVKAEDDFCVNSGNIGEFWNYAVEVAC